MTRTALSATKVTIPELAARREACWFCTTGWYHLRDRLRRYWITNCVVAYPETYRVSTGAPLAS